MIGDQQMHPLHGYIAAQHALDLMNEANDERLAREAKASRVGSAPTGLRSGLARAVVAAGRGIETVGHRMEPVSTARNSTRL
jgi:hypothetical protein